MKKCIIYLLDIVFIAIFGLAAIWFIDKGITSYKALPYQRIINNHQRLTYMEAKATSLLRIEELRKFSFWENSSQRKLIAQVDSIAGEEQGVMLQIENFPEMYSEMRQNAQKLHDLMVTFRTFRANKFRELSKEEDIMNIYADTLVSFSKEHYEYSIIFSEEESRMDNIPLLLYLFTN